MDQSVDRSDVTNGGSLGPLRSTCLWLLGAALAVASIYLITYFSIRDYDYVWSGDISATEVGLATDVWVMFTEDEGVFFPVFESIEDDKVRGDMKCYDKSLESGVNSWLFILFRPLIYLEYSIRGQASMPA